jgi:very-short-patch-repair endonuclease
MHQHILDAGLPKPEIEYKFHPTREYRFDFAWPKQKIAVEVEGGTYNGGRHVTPSGYEKDCEKYNDAAFYGWKVIRVTSKMIGDLRAIETVLRFFGHTQEYDSRITSRKRKTPAYGK